MNNNIYINDENENEIHNSCCILMIIGLIYNRYKKKYIPDEELSNFSSSKKYLLDEDKIIRKTNSLDSYKL